MFTIHEFQRWRLHGMTGLFIIRNFNVLNIHFREMDVALLADKFDNTINTYSNLIPELITEPSTSNQIQIAVLDNILMQCEAAQAEFEFIKNDYPGNNDCLEQSIDIIKSLIADVERDLRTLLSQEEDLAALAEIMDQIDFE